MEYYEILLPLALLLVASKLFMKLCARINIPSVVGMLLAGVFVGLIQYIPGQDILNTTSLTGLGFIAKIGVILIMFSAGIETDLGQIKKVGGPAVIITLAGVVCPMALGFVVAVLCHGGFAALTTEVAAHVQAMEESIVQMESGASDPDVAEQDLAFHQLIAKASGNEIILQVFQAMRSIYSRMFEENVALLGKVGSEHHRRILLAVQTRDMQTARQCMLEHLDDTMRAICRS